MTEIELNRFFDLRRHMKIAHHIPGRIRLKIGVSALKELGTVNKSDVEGFLNEIDGIKEVRINEAAGSVVISYAPGRVAPERWEQLMHADRKQAGPLLESMMKPGITKETPTTATTTATTFG